MKARYALFPVVLCMVLVGCTVPAAPGSGASRRQLGGAAPTALAAPATSEPFAQSLAAFEVELEAVRQESKIPGLSAAVVKDGQVVWARGLGYADIENQVPAAPETPYNLASVTKPFAALVIMQLVQDGKLSLDDPVSRYGVTLPEGDQVLVRHLMSHTSEGTPGERFQYNGSRYALLSRVVLAATGRSLQDWLHERILLPLGMQDTAPGPPTKCTGLSFAPECERVYAALARPYMLDAGLNPVPGLCVDSFDGAAGLISTVLDLAKLDAALDANTLVAAATKEQMWTPGVSNSGQSLPYGLGWFTQSYRGARLIWHYGFSPPSTSALFLKLPEEGLTFIALANTDGLSRPVPWNESDVLTSLVALTFYKRFVLAPQYGQPLPAIDWSAGSSTVLTQVSRVQHHAVRDLLNREFRARSALASSLAEVKAAAERMTQMRATAEKLAKTLDPQTFNLYAGTYEFPEAGGLIVTVSRAEDKLYANTPGKPPAELLPLSATSFFLPVGYDFYQVDFVSDPAGGPFRLLLTLYGMSFTGWRK